ncbi:MAG TPA: hypothetical protein PLL53_12205, partial [Saprospiraceae bacterium]|nr:hypothetical protein [Saprospiraceae bacterium]
MKKPLLILAFATMFSGSLSAQFSLALQGGMQQSRYIYSGENPQVIPGASTNPPRFLAGYHIGLVPAIKAASGKLELSAPLSFVQRQFQSGPEIPDMPIARDRYQSLELNPRIGLFISPDFSVTGGVYANYITQIHFDPGDGNWGKVPKWIREMLFNPVDFGFAGGLRYAVNRFYVYGNAQYGLIPLVDFGATD